MLACLSGECSSFRNCKVAAPLKQPSSHTGHGGGRFVSATAKLRAPIEAIIPERNIAVERCFRNCKVAAPLKRRGRRPDGILGDAFPQLQSCGPIEAWIPSGATPTSYAFPQLQSCGPIEALQIKNKVLFLTLVSATAKLRPH